MPAGSQHISMAIENVNEVVAGIKHKQEQGAKAVNSTIGDFTRRGPGWVSQEITGIYNIKKKDITESQKGKRNGGKVKVYATSIEDVKLVYRGRLLTPIHFGMKPAKRPKRSYRVSMEVKKGERRNLPKGVFLAPAETGAKQIPFQREGKDRLPIASKHSVSVPQMITNKEVSDNIYQRLNQELAKRLEHNISRFNNK